MRSGIPDPPDYIALVDRGFTPAELLKRVPGPLFAAGSEISYADINYILLGMIIEHVTGRPLWGALRSGVLDHPGLDGLVYGVKGALAADGWRIESDPASLARWGYELYGGFVLSDDSLREMTDFRGDWYGWGPSTSHGFLRSPATMTSRLSGTAERKHPMRSGLLRSLRRMSLSRFRPTSELFTTSGRRWKP
jgi:CubicO group peptidase (beta-lactamase class C family)